jgi:hypothetical protein
MELFMSFPGDMGWLMRNCDNFKTSWKSDPICCVNGLYEGDIPDNHYGRIREAKAKIRKESHGKNIRQCSRIIEYKDIMNLGDKKRIK